MSYRLDGTYIENCSCDVLCPCLTSGFTAPADADRCRVVLAFHVDAGEVEGIDVSDHSAVVVADAPPVMADGNWRVGLIIDERASPAQAEALGRVFGGQLGGPMAAFAPLIGEMLGVERAAIDYVDEGRLHRLKVGSAIDLEVEDIVEQQRPNAPALTISGVAHPVNSTLTISRARRGRVRAFGMEWDNSGKNGHSAPFSWRA